MRKNTRHRDSNNETIYSDDQLEDERGNILDVIELEDGTFALRPVGTSFTWRMATDRMTIIQMVCDDCRSYGPNCPEHGITARNQ